MKLRLLHRTSALLIALFAVLHLSNHLASLWSIDAHLYIMTALRTVYRQPVVEVILLLCVGFQAASGLFMVVWGWSGRSGYVAWLQALSGIYLAAFLCFHVAAVLYGRASLGLDTNFFFAAAGLHVPPYQWFFAPYYTLAVFSLFAHLGCAWYWHFFEAKPGRAATGLVAALVIGFAVSISISFSLAGKIQPVTIPAKYLDTYGVQ